MPEIGDTQPAPEYIITLHPQFCLSIGWQVAANRSQLIDQGIER
jgi:hypothetical protein